MKRTKKPKFPKARYIKEGYSKDKFIDFLDLTGAIFLFIILALIGISFLQKLVIYLFF